MIITIDGPAGVGKTTVGKLTANKLGIGFLDTGIMYRALTWSLLKNNLEDSSIDKILIHLKNLTFDLDIRNVDTTTIFINKINVTDLLNSPQVEEYVSKISSFREVREIMVIKQRDIVKNTSSLVVGRDIGTIVLPNAKSKFYLTASAEERAKRRFSEINKSDINYDSVLENLNYRDITDSTRDIAPLKKAKDAYSVDVSDLSIDEVFEKVLNIIKK